MRALTTVRSLVFLLGATVLSGCYTYVPIERPSPGTEVRVHVPVTSAVARPGMEEDGFTLEGRVLAMGDSLVLLSETNTQLGAYRELTRVDTLRMDPTKLSGIDERVFSQGRTLALSAGLAAAAVGGFFAFSSFGGGGAGDGPNGNGEPSASIAVGSILAGLLGFIGR